MSTHRAYHSEGANRVRPVHRRGCVLGCSSNGDHLHSWPADRHFKRNRYASIVGNNPNEAAACGSEWSAGFLEAALITTRQLPFALMHERLLQEVGVHAVDLRKHNRPSRHKLRRTQTIYFVRGRALNGVRLLRSAAACAAAALATRARKALAANRSKKRAQALCTLHWYYLQAGTFWPTCTGKIRIPFPSVHSDSVTPFSSVAISRNSAIQNVNGYVLIRIREAPVITVANNASSFNHHGVTTQPESTPPVGLRLRSWGGSARATGAGSCRPASRLRELQLSARPVRSALPPTHSRGEERGSRRFHDERIDRTVHGRNERRDASLAGW
jgi:hypothetical protein